MVRIVKSVLLWVVLCGLVGCGDRAVEKAKDRQDIETLRKLDEYLTGLRKRAADVGIIPKNASCKLQQNELEYFLTKFGEPTNRNDNSIEVSLEYLPEKVWVAFVPSSFGFKLMAVSDAPDGKELTDRIEPAEAARRLRGRAVRESQAGEPPISAAAVAKEKTVASAAAHLRYAKKLLAQKKQSEGDARLREIVEKFPDTPAAAEANSLLENDGPK